MAKKDDSTEVAIKKTAELSTNVFDVNDFGSDIGSGMEGADKDSFAIPFLGVLQKISPQCEESDAKFIEGAKGGMLFNSVSGKLFDGKTGVLVLPAAYQRRFLKWGPRGTPSAGFKGEVMPEVAAQMKDNGDVVEQDGRLYFPLEDGTVDDKKCDRLTDTRNHFVILVDEETGAYSKVVISLASTQIKKSKALMTMLSEVKVATPKGNVTPPTWFNRVRVVSVPESNDKGTWSGIKFAIEGNLQTHPNGNELYLAAKEFHSAIEKGTAGPVHYEDPDANTETAPDGSF